MSAIATTLNDAVERNLAGDHVAARFIWTSALIDPVEYELALAGHHEEIKPLTEIVDVREHRKHRTNVCGRCHLEHRGECF